MSEGAGVGYVLKRFPVLSETFILNELLSLEARGVPLHIFSLERPNDPRYHNDLPKLKARISYVPGPSELSRLTAHNRRVAKAYPQGFLRTAMYAAAKGSPTLLWRLLQAGYVANEAKRLKLKHLHSHFANRPTSVAMLASRISGIPFSFTAHATDIFKVKVDSKVLVRKMDAARFVVAISDYNERYMRERAPSAGRIVRINNGIDLDRFSPNGRPDDSVFRFVCVARLVEKKGLPLLIEACAALRDSGIAFECRLVGKGGLRSKLERMIRDLKLRDQVRMVGPKTQIEVRDEYRRAQAYVLPCVIGSDGNREGLPVSLVEALACGLPVITTAITGIPEVVTNEHNGLLVPVGDSAALAEGMRRLATDPALYERLAMNARPSVSTAFDRAGTSAALHAAFDGAAA
ncbi:MAG TPA: glycosyltransferase [Longimicrobiales bacterium]|nr:glycosyltransferase [Longimicrobiales bacterium]